MMDLPFRQLPGPLPGWQPANAARDDSPFRSTHAKTLAQLARELDALDAVDYHAGVVCSRPDAFRIDGGLRANAKVDHPGVTLTIVTRGLGTLVYSTDRYAGRYSSEGWKENLRAITLGLEALRKVERYGVADRGQQYAGYRELGSGIPMAAPAMTIEEAAHVLGHPVDDLLADRGRVEAAFRFLAKSHHPDHGGDEAKFKRIVEARDLLLTAAAPSSTTLGGGG